MEITPPKSQSYWDTFPNRQQLCNAKKHREESLAQWAARLTMMGEDAGCANIILLDMMLRDKFVAGLDPGPMQEFFEPRTDIYTLTFKQVLDLAFTTAARFEREARAKAKAKAIQDAAAADSD